MTTSALDLQRLAQLESYDVLGRPARADLVAIAEVAAHVAQTPMATVNLFTESEQHSIATWGFDPSVCRREDSMCHYVLHDPAPVVIPDARLDSRFREHPQVNGLLGDIRFYASYQLVSPSGVVIGRLCVFDTEPREMTVDQARALEALVGRVVDLLELGLRTRELERSNEQLAAFAGQVSHDLRNPLTAVSMSLSMVREQIAEEGIDEEELSWLVNRAASGAERMQALIGDLLAFARLGGSLAREPVDLAEVVAHVCEDLAVELEGATVSVAPLPTVSGDPVQLRALLQNLVSNAAKFTATGVPARIEISGEHEGDHWRVRVVDHGLGIPPEDRSRVFEPFTRVHKTLPGSGIGLATVRRIVDAHGGRIGLDETPGGGTTAWFELPG